MLNKFNKKKQNANTTENSTENSAKNADDYSIKESPNKSTYRKAVAVMVVVALLMFGAGMKYARFLEGKPLTDIAEAGNIVQTDDFANPVASTDLVVEVQGCADKTGYFSVSNSTSLRELIEYVHVKADGDISSFDFNHKLQQGDSYYIKSKNNPVDAKDWLTNDGSGTDTENTENAESTSDSNGGNAENNEENSENSSDSESGKININTADLSQLMELEGIGETKGQAIIDYREKHGGFNRPEDILAVKGIGSKTYEKFKDKITV